MLNAVIEQPIWTGGRINASIARSRAQLEVQRATLDETARDLMLRAVQAYFDVAQAARRIDVLKQALANHNDLVQIISRRVDQQVSPQSDLDLARARLSQVEQQMAQALAQRGAAVNTLIELTGDQNPALGDAPAYNPELHHPSVDGAVEKAWACDPRAARLTAQSMVAQAERKAARAALFPQLVGQVSSNEVLGERIGVALRAQTGNGLSQAAAAQGASERSRAAEEAIAIARRELRESVRLDFVTNGVARERLASARVAAESAKFVVGSYKRQFIAGRRTWLDVMNALQESNNTLLAVVDAETGAQLSAARIALRTCAWEPRPQFNATEPRDGEQ